jgi:HPt (histidine-containing phosphotransfer) domain-containing protein
MTETDRKPVFDRQVLLERMGGDGELLDDVLTVFIEEIPGMMSELRAAVSGMDAPALERSAHSMKGALLNISADSPAELTRQLEQLGSAGQLDGVTGILVRLESEIEQLTRILQGGEERL